MGTTPTQTTNVPRRPPKSHQGPFLAAVRDVRGHLEAVVVDCRTNRAEVICPSRDEAKVLAEQMNWAARA